MDTDVSPYKAPLTDVVERTPSLRRAYVLFMDIVGFTRLPTDHQVAAQRELGQLVQNTAEVVNYRNDADSLILRPTGDGMALLFFKDMLSPLRAALQIHALLQSDAVRIKSLVGAPFKLRMGIHAGEVTIVPDVNGLTDAAGDGIITAQRVMDLGDSDHILLSHEIAKVLLNMDPWARYITDLGEVRVKHGVLINVYNLYGRLDGPFCGNPGIPKKIAEDGRARNREARAARPKLRDILLPYRKLIVTLMLLGLIGYGVNEHYKSNPAPYLKARDTVRDRLIVKLPTNVRKGIPKKWNIGGLGEEVRKPQPPPPPVKKAVVPDLIGMDTNQADAKAQAARLQLDIRVGEFTRYDENVIYRQQPAPGKKLAPNSRIIVTVSRGLKTGAAKAWDPDAGKSQSDAGNDDAGGSLDPGDNKTTNLDPGDN
jgi:class 3 adenylate cyclase